MQRILILLFCLTPLLSRAQHDVLALEKNGMHVRSYTVGDPMTFETVYGQWFTGTIDDLHHDTVYINGQAFSYKEIAALAREKTTGLTGKGTGIAAIIVGGGVFGLGAFNGAYRGDPAKSWYTTSGVVLGSALIATGVVLLATAKKYYKLGGRFKLQYLQIGR
jgi:hypothetical protein